MAISQVEAVQHDMWYRHRLAFVFEIIFCGALVSSLFIATSTRHILASLFLLAISFLPLLIEYYYKVRISALMQAMYVGFLFVSMFAGEVMGLYGKIPFWDKLVHFSSGIVFGTMIFVWLHEQARRHHIRLTKTLYGLGMMGIMALGTVLWELIEFVSDALFGTFSQGGSLLDTDLDMLCNTAGSLVALVLVLLYLSGRSVPLVSSLIRQHDALNQ